MNKHVNFLTYLRDNYAGRPARVMLNVLLVGILTFLVLWIASIFDLTPPLSTKALIGFGIAVTMVLILALLICRRWPPQ